MKNKVLITIALVFLAFLAQTQSFAAFPIKQERIISSSGVYNYANSKGDFTPIPDKGKKSKKDMGVTALVLGIVGIFTMPIGFVCSILAIVFGSQSLNGENRSMARTGMILGIVGVTIAVLYILLFLFALGILSLA